MPERYTRIIVNGRRVLEHRHVMQQHLGYELPRTMHVHHRNGNRYDNRLENLEVINGREHARLHSPQVLPLTKTCEHCGTVFTPHPTKRRRARGCSVRCGRVIAGIARRSLSDADRVAMRGRYCLGATQMQLASEFGVTQATVWETVRKVGPPCVQWIAQRLIDAERAA